MSGIEIFQVIFIATVFVVGVGGIIKAIFFDKD